MYKRTIGLSIIIFTFFCLISSDVYATAPDVSANSAIVIDQQTGRVLYSKNIDEHRAMASTTKIMTAIVAIENGNLKDMVKVSEKASGVEGSSIWLEENEELSLEELLYGLMLSSGNDAAHAIGEHIGNGELENFIDMMNNKAREINALNTSFANPHGLDHKKHYTTAHDLAKIAAYAMNDDTFKKIVSTKKKSISWPNHEWNRALHNKNKMLWNYEGGNGIKTGYTGQAGKCLVSSALKDNMQLISVVLASNDIWKDSTIMLDYSFITYKPYLIVGQEEYLRSIPVKDGTKERISVYSKKDILLPIKEDEKEKVKVQLTLPDQIKAPVDADQIIGKLDVYIGEEKIDTTEIYVKENIEKKDTENMFKKFMKYWIGS